MNNIRLDRRPIPNYTQNLMRSNAYLFIDAEKHEKYMLENTLIEANAEDILRKTMGDINFDSTQQLQQGLFKLGFSENDLKSRGKLSTDKDTIKRLKSAYPDCKELGVLLAKREASSNLKYLKGIKNFAKLHDNVGNNNQTLWTIPFEYNDLVTHRIATYNPNLQGIPNRMRDLITSEKGYELMYLDMKRQELNIFFNYPVRNSTLIQLLNDNPDDGYLAFTQFCVSKKNFESKIRDIVQKGWIETYPEFKKYFNSEQAIDQVYRGVINRTQLNYKEVYSDLIQNLVPMSSIDTSLRNSYKKSILSGAYGGSLSSLQNSSGEEIGGDIYDVYETLPQYQEYKNNIRNYIQNGGKYFLSAFGSICDCVKRTHNEKVRAGLNYPTQSTAFDLLCFATEDMVNLMYYYNIGYETLRPCLSKHDELLLYVKKGNRGICEELNENVFSMQIDNWTPIYCGYNISDSYSDK